MNTIVLVLLSGALILDWYTTRVILRRGGQELHGLMATLIDAFGLDLGLAVKTAATIAFALMCFEFNYSEYVWALFGYYVCVIESNWRSMPK